MSIYFPAVTGNMEPRTGVEMRGIPIKVLNTEKPKIKDRLYSRLANDLRALLSHESVAAYLLQDHSFLTLVLELLSQLQWR